MASQHCMSRMVPAICILTPFFHQLRHFNVSQGVIIDQYIQPICVIRGLECHVSNFFPITQTVLHPLDLLICYIAHLGADRGQSVFRDILRSGYDEEFEDVVAREYVSAT